MAPHRQHRLNQPQPRRQAQLHRSSRQRRGRRGRRPPPVVRHRRQAAGGRRQAADSLRPHALAARPSAL